MIRRLLISAALVLAGCGSTTPSAAPVTITSTSISTIQETTTATVTVEVEPEYASEEIRVCTNARNDLARYSVTDMLKRVAAGDPNRLHVITWATIQISYEPLDKGNASGPVASRISIMNQLMIQLAGETDDTVYLPAVAGAYLELRDDCLDIGADWPIST